MKMTKCLLFCTAVSSFVIASEYLTCAAEIRGVSKDTIAVGIIVDQSGPAAAAVTYADAAKNYFRYVNDHGGIHGRKIRLIAEDDRYTIPGAFAAFKKLVFKDEVLTILACGGTGQTTALFSSIEKNHMPVNTLSWSWTMTDPVRRYVFTPGNDNKDEMKIIMDYIVNTLKPKNPRIAVVCPDVEYGKSGTKVARMKAKEHDVELVKGEIIPISAIDLSSQVLSLKRKKASHIVSLTITGPTLALLRNSKRLGYSPVFVGSFHIFEDEVAQAGGELAKKVYAAGAFGSWFDETKGVSKLKETSLQYTPHMKPPNRYYLKGWITAKITHEGMKRAGKDLDGQSLVNALETIQNLDMEDLTGPISYSPTDHKGNDYARMYKADIKKGYFVPVTDWIKSE